MTEYRNILSEIDKEWNRIAERYVFECRKCGECCRYQVVPVSWTIEALFLLEHLGNLDIATQNNIIERAKMYRKIVSARGYPRFPSIPIFAPQIAINQINKDLAGVPCPLLSDDNLCELYEARPLVCRIYGLPAKKYPLADCFSDITELTIDDIDIYPKWSPFSRRISKLELRLSIDAMNWNTMFVADVLLSVGKMTK